MPNDSSPPDSAANKPVVLETRGDPALCGDCRTIFASFEAANKLTTGGSIEHYCCRWTAKESERDDCPFCRVLLAIVGLSDSLDGRLEPAREQPDLDAQPKTGSEEKLRFLFRRNETEQHTIEVIAKSESGPDQVAYLEISAHQGIHDFDATKEVSKCSPT
jgi:hypothetical protein